ncbi:MAG TPA: translation initiation factor IF-2 [Firmicutes bacterium]|jgi:translation initiation factor IF-2|nr:translation initiation factor IF-2 [Bacillota bacterium]
MLLTRKRIYELAKELKISSKDLMELMQEMGFSVKNHMSTISEEEARQVIELLTGPEDDGGEFDWADEDDTPAAAVKKKKDKIKAKKKGAETTPAKTEEPKSRAVELPESLTVRELAEKLGQAPKNMVMRLMEMGVMAALNQEVDYETARVVAEKFGIETKPIQLEQDSDTMDIEIEEDDPASLRPRPPVVTVMGHVDHGKTSLLDAIRETKVTAVEAGGITQHIGASVVEYQGKKIVFLDTPGHEAFTAMRARGAQVTDIAVLVVAADDGVMPQTVEAINHAKAAEVPIIVALNKMDRPDAQPERIKQQLTEYGLVVEEWGGDTICVPVSALKKEGIDELLEMILLVAELSELKANPDRFAMGTVIEAKLDKGRGPVATVLVQRGTLRVGDPIIAGTAWGRVRAMMNDRGENVKEAGPSTPVEVLGFSEVPQAGDIMRAMKDDKAARQLAKERQEEQREQELARSARISLDDLYDRIQEGEIKELNIIIKADVQGSVEALKQSLEKLSDEQVRLNVIHGGAGAITESDVMLASASNAVIIGFNVRPEPSAKKEAEREEVDIRLYRVIYDALEDMEAAMKGMLEPEYREVTLGQVEVRTTFKVPKVGTIAGSYVLEGKVVNGSPVRLIRDGVVIYEGKIESLRRFKDDVREVASGYECGIGLHNFNDIKEGDILEVYTVEEVRPA